jgi:hypothetical protein
MALTPTTVNVREQNALGPNGRVQKAIVITYKVGDHGPFTLVTNQADIASGKAQQQMNAFAATLATLPDAGS